MRLKFFSIRFNTIGRRHKGYDKPLPMIKADLDVAYQLKRN